MIAALTEFLALPAKGGRSPCALQCTRVPPVRRRHKKLFDLCPDRRPSESTRQLKPALNAFAITFAGRIVPSNAN